MPQAKPRILFVDQQGQLGGAELSLLDIARAYRTHCTVALFADGKFHAKLREAGVDTRILQVRAAAGGIPRSAGALRAMAGLPALAGLVVRLARLARGYDLIYANTQKAALVSAMAGQLAGRPVIWHLRDIITAPEFSGLARRTVVAAANRGMARVIANSEATRSSFLEAGGIAERTRVVHNGLPVPLASEGIGNPAARLRAELGLTTEPLVGLFGRISPWKGQQILVEAVARLPGVHALIVGEPLPNEPECQDLLREHIAKHNVQDRVHLLGFRDNVHTLMQATDIVVHASTSPEPFGRVIVEAMLVNRPVIAASAGGVLEIVTHDATGLLVPPSDPPALADAIHALLNDPERRSRIAQAGFEHAMSRFTVASLLDGVAREIEDVLKGSGHGGRTGGPAAEATKA